MHQRVDRHQARADLPPAWPLRAGAQQQVRQRHRQDLVRNSIDIAQRTDDGLAEGGESVGRLGLYGGQLPSSLTDWRCIRLLRSSLIVASGNAQPYFSAFVPLGIGWLLGRMHRPL
jgi:hypothetical protein